MLVFQQRGKTEIEGTKEHQWSVSVGGPG